uniref:Uncharacterized protein n=1 Tax=Timspurckia oligopyrenoides TaxID=708627 RepID=A0A7S0ZK01_9RHOD|mmetsp:Transcript_8008/g.14531  ORF Transcript_8008/g.14531 Transcript_8008/m.14531 type:complete len:228 (+) Transcript_8008:1237-1920(+)
MDELFRGARKIAVKGRGQVEGIEKAVAAGGVASEMELAQFGESINMLFSAMQQLHTLLPREPMNRRQLWTDKIVQLDEELSLLQNANQKLWTERNEELMQRNLRQQLFGEVHGASNGDAAISMGGFGGGNGPMYSFEEEAKMLNSSNSTVDTILMTGRSALDSLQLQGATLKGTKRKMLDVANSMGVSKKLIRSIEKKENETAVIIYGGMIILSFVLVVLFIWKKVL